MRAFLDVQHRGTLPSPARTILARGGAGDEGTRAATEHEPGVVDLVYHRHDRTLTAATYGRSMWRLSLT